MDLQNMLQHKGMHCRPTHSQGDGREGPLAKQVACSLPPACKSGCPFSPETSRAIAACNISLDLQIIVTCRNWGALA